MAGYVDDNLLPGEHVIYRTSLHPVIYLAPATVIVAGLVIGATQTALAGLAALAGGLALLLVTWIRQWSSEFAVTDRRVGIKTGWLARRTIELNMSKVESIEVSQGLVRRLLDYGTITVIGTGGTMEPFAMIAGPLGLPRAVQSQQA